MNVTYCSMFSLLQLEHCFEGAHLVFAAVEQRLTGSSQNEMKAVKSSIALMLYLLAKLHLSQGSQGLQTADQVAQMRVCARKSIQDLLENWIMRGGVIGSSKFGGSSVWQMKFEQEVKVSAQCAVIREWIYTLFSCGSTCWN